MICTLVHEPQHDLSQCGLGGHDDVGFHIKGCLPGTTLEGNVEELFDFIQSFHDISTKQDLLTFLSQKCKEGNAPSDRLLGPRVVVSPPVVIPPDPPIRYGY